MCNCVSSSYSILGAFELKRRLHSILFSVCAGSLRKVAGPTVSRGWTFWAFFWGTKVILVILSLEMNRPWLLHKPKTNPFLQRMFVKEDSSSDKNETHFLFLTDESTNTSASGSLTSLAIWLPTLEKATNSGFPGFAGIRDGIASCASWYGVISACSSSSDYT